MADAPAIATPEAPATPAPVTPEVPATPEAKAPEAKPEVKAPEVKAPDTYGKFDLPAGVELDAALMETAVPVFKDLGLNQDAAQKLVALYAKQVQGMADAEKAALDARDAEWTAAVKADTEFGGAKLQENLTAAEYAVEQLGGKPLKDALNQTRLGNEPNLVKAFIRMGKLLKEGKMITTQTPPAPAEMTLKDALYPGGMKQ